MALVARERFRKCQLHCEHLRPRPRRCGLRPRAAPQRWLHRPRSRYRAVELPWIPQRRLGGPQAEPGPLVRKRAHHQLAAHPPTSIQGVEARGEVPARSRRRRHRSLPEPPSHRAHPKRAHRRRYRIWKNDLGLGTVPNRPHRVGDARLHLHPGSQGRALFSHCAPRRKERREGGHDRLLRFEDLRRMAAPSASHRLRQGRQWPVPRRDARRNPHPRLDAHPRPP